MALITICFQLFLVCGAVSSMAHASLYNLNSRTHLFQQLMKNSRGTGNFFEKYIMNLIML